MDKISLSAFNKALAFLAAAEGDDDAAEVDGPEACAALLFRVAKAIENLSATAARVADNLADCAGCARCGNCTNHKPARFVPALK